MNHTGKTPLDTAPAPAETDRGEGEGKKGMKFAKWSTCERIMKRDYDLFRRLADA